MLDYRETECTEFFIVIVKRKQFSALLGLKNIILKFRKYLLMLTKTTSFQLREYVSKSKTALSINKRLNPWHCNWMSNCHQKMHSRAIRLKCFLLPRFRKKCRWATGESFLYARTGAGTETPRRNKWIQFCFLFYVCKGWRHLYPLNYCRFKSVTETIQYSIFIRCS